MSISRTVWARLPTPVKRALRPVAGFLNRRRVIAAQAGSAIETPVEVVQTAEVSDAVVAEPEPSASADGEPEVLRTLDDLDRKLLEVDAAWAISDDEMRKVFKSFRMEFPLPLPDDPFDPEYRQRQFEVYERVSGKSYAVANERSYFDVDPARPFPYYTESFDTVSHHLMALGFIIQTMRLPSKATVLE